ncbi:MAG: hypothetical protein ACPK85_01695 [Methanosarcina sp.]
MKIKSKFGNEKKRKKLENNSKNPNKNSNLKLELEAKNIKKGKENWIYLKKFI